MRTLIAVALVLISVSAMAAAPADANAGAQSILRLIGWIPAIIAYTQRRKEIGGNPPSFRWSEK